MQYIGKNNELLWLLNISNENCTRLQEQIESSLTLLWFQDDDTELIIDHKKHCFKANEILCTTEFHYVKTVKVGNIKMVRFNRQFYCILHHDSDISCKGVLFFGASQLPIIKLLEADLSKFNTLWSMFEIELESNDELQLDMLQMMLKRYLILCTRIFKVQNNFDNLPKIQLDLVREFNFLVEKHFKTKHTVKEYAEMLNKSPKTISNLFSKIDSKSPLQYIQERKLLEARRLLAHTDYAIKSIAYDIGFEDIQAFSRFFKNYEGVSPTEFKEKLLSGTIANS